MKLNKIATAVSISLAALALTACGSDKKASNPSTPAPGGKPDTSVNNNEAAIKALVEAAKAVGLTQANAEAFAKANPKLLPNSPEFKQLIAEAKAKQDAEQANAGNTTNNPIAPIVDESNPFVEGYDSAKTSSVSADHYTRQMDANFDLSANKEADHYGSSGISTSITTNKQNPYLSNFVLGTESFGKDNKGSPKQDAVDVIGRVVYSDGKVQTFDDAKKEPTHFEYTVQSYYDGDKKISHLNKTDPKNATDAYHHLPLQYVNQFNVEIGDLIENQHTARVTSVTGGNLDNLRKVAATDKTKVIEIGIVRAVTHELLDDKGNKLATLSSQKELDDYLVTRNDIDATEKKKITDAYTQAVTENPATPRTHSQAVLWSVDTGEKYESVKNPGAKTTAGVDSNITLKTTIEYNNTDHDAGAKSGLVAYNTSSSLPIYGVEENTYTLKDGKLVVLNPDTRVGNLATHPYRARDIEDATKAGANSDGNEKLPAVANDFETRIFGKNYRALENGKTIDAARLSNNSYMAQYDSKGNANRISEMKLKNVQYGRITTNIDALAQDPTTKVDYISRRYEEHGAPTTVDKYFYRGTNETTIDEMNKVIAKGGSIEYRGHALTYGLGPLANDQGRTELPTAYGSVRVSTIGNFVEATYDTKKAELKGSVYNLLNDDVRANNNRLSGYKKQELATFVGNVKGNTVVGSSAKVGTEDKGSLTASFYGSNAEELGGQISSITRKEGYGQSDWGAVFGASKVGVGGNNYDTSSSTNTTGTK